MSELSDIKTYRCSIQEYEDGDWTEVNAPYPSCAAEEHVERWDRQSADYICAGKGEEVIVIVLDDQDNKYTYRVFGESQPHYSSVEL